MTDLAYVDVRPLLAKVADLGRELVLVGGQAVNFWASYYERRVPELAREAPFTSKDIDFCGDQRAVRVCAERLGGTAHVATFDDATPNSGTVVFVDGAGVKRTLDVVSAPFWPRGLRGRRDRALRRNPRPSRHASSDRTTCPWSSFALHDPRDRWS